MANQNRLVIISGLSGSGKSTAVKALEDLGYFCVDNLPVVLLPKFVELFLQSAGEITKVALVMDLRAPEFLQQYPKVFSEIRNLGYQLDILFLDASTEVLLRRFSETRRKHPLVNEGSLREGIEEERKKLSDLKLMADWVIDTSSLNSHHLKRLIIDRFKQVDIKRLVINLVSFGFSYGIPTEADLVFDVRFLPNPYFQDDLKNKSGNEPEVISWIFQTELAKAFLEKILDLLLFLLPHYEIEGKAYLTIAIGCTGGIHRSVGLVNKIGEGLSSSGYHIRIHHRDVYRLATKCNNEP